MTFALALCTTVVSRAHCIFVSLVHGSSHFSGLTSSHHSLHLRESSTAHYAGLLIPCAEVSLAKSIVHWVPHNHGIDVK